MAKKALCLSGGGARGSFQMGAIRCLYEVYGFRPDVIAATSVGAVNGIRLALEPPPADNDAQAVLREVAAGRRDAQFEAMLALEQEWLAFLSPDDFFSIGASFLDTPVEDVVRGLNNPHYDEPMNVGVAKKIDEISVWINVPLAHLVAGPIIADQLQKLRSLVEKLAVENSLLTLAPVRAKLFDPQRIDLMKLAQGTPLYLACVALESGRLRYATGKGEFVERDGRSPVLSALTKADIDAAVDENLQPLDPARRQRIEDLLAGYAQAVTSIAESQHEFNSWDTTPARRKMLAAQIDRHRQRGDYRIQALRAQLKDVHIRSGIDPRVGVLASAAMPAYFDPPLVGTERYVDGGIREIIPVHVVLDHRIEELVGVVCSATILAETASFDRAGVLGVAARTLTDIALKEIVEGDMDAVRATGVQARFIVPNFDVHDTVVVQPSLIEISMHYGWMRACDEMQLATEAERLTFRERSDLVTRLRLECLHWERQLAAHQEVVSAVDQQATVHTLRVLRWSIANICASRSREGLPAHPLQASWGLAWEREFRSARPYGAASVWNVPPFGDADGTTFRGAPDACAAEFAPDHGCLVDAGTDRVYWLVRGAVFYAASDSQTTTSHLPDIVVPTFLNVYLPKIPAGTHLMAEVQDELSIWVIRSGRRFRLTDVQLAASGLAGQAVAKVPPGGLAQIPDGGAPYWLGGLVITDAQGVPVERWEPTPQYEHNPAEVTVPLLNRTGDVVRVDAVVLASSQDAPGDPAFRVLTELPLDVPGGTLMHLRVQFDPNMIGTVHGTVSVTCTDSTVRQFSVPLSTAVRPMGEHGELQVDPASIDFGACRVGATITRSVTLTNVGTRGISISPLRVESDGPASSFTAPPVWRTFLSTGESDIVWVSCLPSVRGVMRATLAIDTRSDTSSGYPYIRRHEIALAASAQAPVIFLAAHGRPPTGRPNRGAADSPILRPPTPPNVRVELELQTLDFGFAPSGTRASASFWVRNVGDLPLQVQGVAIRRLDTFSVPDGSMFPVTLPPGGEFEVRCECLAPSQAGAIAVDTFGIASDDPTRPMAELQVRGRAAGPHLSEPPEGLELGSGSPPSPQMLTFVSDGTDPVTIKEIGLQDGTAFELGGVPALPLQLMPGTSLTLSVSCRAIQLGQWNDTLFMVHDGKASRRTQIVLHAEFT